MKIKNARVFGQTKSSYLISFDTENYTEKGLLFFDYIPNSTNFKVGDLLSNLLIVNFNKNGPILGFVDYPNPYIYNMLSRYSLFAQIYNFWPYHCDKDFDLKFNINTIEIEGRIYYLLDNHNYMIPLFGSDKLPYIEGNSKFFPNIHTSKHQVYKIDEKRVFLPKKYKAQIYLHNSKLYDVYIYIHGFIYPTKWHFGIWKHKNNFSSDYFKNCKKNEKNTNCDSNHCSNNGLFQKVHPKIVNDCYDYLEDIVTFFESKWTNRIVTVHKKNDEHFYRIFCQCEGMMKNNPFILILYGICWNLSGNEKTLHFNPVTFYLRERGPTVIYEQKENFGKIVIDKGQIKDLEDVTKRDN